MKILLITRYFPPLEGIATLRMRAFAERWADCGHKVTVLTTSKAVEGDYAYPGIEVHPVSYFDPITFIGGEQPSSGSGNSYLKRLYRTRLNERMPHRTDFWTSQAKKALARFDGFDLIVSSYGPYTPHLVALEAKRRFNCAWVADFRDLWCENHTYRGIWPFTLLEKRLEKKVCSQADIITTVSEGLKRRLQKSYPTARIDVVPNGFNPSVFPRAVEKPSRPFHFLYTGTVFEKGHDIAAFLEGVERSGGSFHVEFIGTVSSKFTQSSRVSYSGRIPYAEALSEQMKADALVLLDYRLEGYEGLLSGKVYEYLYTGKPILAVGVKAESELGMLLTKSGGAVLCGYSPDEICKGLEKVMRGEIPPQNRDEVLRFSRASQADAIISLAANCSQRAMSDS
ncbi:MAG: glycosyltransferase [Chlamydiia bacterium]|nr:glycosyltransferase [Chlamydiia bacterium]